MRAFFIGGAVDNSELDLGEVSTPPLRYPADSGSGTHRYRLHRTHAPLYAIYAEPELAAEQVEAVFEERGYARRFGPNGG